ncbi:hypothetical protein QQS21_007669 [Conoideocrella luteorostrata]|uniref:Uncharacterized protein n=1 Tax=Conoideocrella luteorostrata TaxID=1105319 RepID=A0AAJ0CL53_9HYPO|nr:hypothetical protein QQS21_007669 [Conoideocrella luteorostrata]
MVTPNAPPANDKLPTFAEFGSRLTEEQTQVPNLAEFRKRLAEEHALRAQPSQEGVEARQRERERIMAEIAAGEAANNVKNVNSKEVPSSLVVRPCTHKTSANIVDEENVQDNDELPTDPLDIDADLGNDGRNARSNDRRGEESNEEYDLDYNNLDSDAYNGVDTVNITAKFGKPNV